MCSNRCANPVRPGRSFAEPTWYQRFTATMGAVWSSESVTNSPFGSRNVSIGMRMAVNCTRIPPLASLVPVVHSVLKSLLLIAGLLLCIYAGLLLMLWARQERIVFQPPGPPFDEEPTPVRVTYTASDGQQLLGYLVPSAERSDSIRHAPPSTLLVFHGNAEIAAWSLPW